MSSKIFAFTRRQILGAALLFVAATQSLSAQSDPKPGRIVGRILDAANGQGLSDVGIQLVGTMVGATSGIDGRYALTNVPAGTITIQVRRIGFRPKTITGLMMTDGSTLEQNIALEEAQLVLQSQVITAAAERGSVNAALDRQRTATGIVNSVTQEQISKSPDGDAAQAVQRVSGVTVQDGKYVFVRGRVHSLVSCLNETATSRSSATPTSSSEQVPLHDRDRGVGRPLPGSPRLPRHLRPGAGMPSNPSCLTLLYASLLLAPVAGEAQATAAAPTPPQLNFSGILFGNYQYRADKANRAINKFDLERAYLNFRMPVGDRTSIRVTTDVYQQLATPADTYYRGWAMRAKFAYIQHDFYNGKDASAYARLGMLNTVVIDHIESYWPRWVSQSSVERAGYFSSADMGISTALTMPRKLGEVVGVVTNGPGYTSREIDRFKDYAARLSLTPLANAKSPLVRSLLFSVWGYQGSLASQFVAGGPGQVGPVNESIKRDRYGFFTAVRDPRMTLAFDLSRRVDEGETGANTAGSPRVVADSTGTVTSAFAVLRPFKFRNEKSTVPIGALFRWDHVKPNRDSDPNYDLLIGGLIWDLSSRTSFSLDYQVTLPKDGPSVAENRTMFMHFVASF